MVRVNADHIGIRRVALEHDVVIEIRPRARTKGVGRVRVVGAA
jgi:hypothetical protein